MPKKTEKIFAVCGNHILLHNSKARTIGYKVCFDSPKQVKRFTGGGCIVPGIICFYYHRSEECVDTFYFEDGVIAYMTVQLDTESYLCEVYSKCVLNRYNEDEFIERVVCAYTFKRMGF